MKPSFLFLLIFLFAAQAFSQTEIAGTVKDANNASIAGANISLQSKQSRNTVVSDLTGAFRFTNVTAGDYQITVTANGFAAQKIDVQVAANETKQLDLKLE